MNATFVATLATCHHVVAVWCIFVCCFVLLKGCCLSSFQSSSDVCPLLLQLRYHKRILVSIFWVLYLIFAIRPEKGHIPTHSHIHSLSPIFAHSNGVIENRNFAIFEIVIVFVIIFALENCNVNLLHPKKPTKTKIEFLQKFNRILNYLQLHADIFCYFSCKILLCLGQRNE